MRNRYPGKCSLCGKVVPPKQGRWRMISKTSQNFQGLRCLACSTTTKGHKEHFEKILGKKFTKAEYRNQIIHKTSQQTNIIHRRIKVKL